MCTFGVQCAGHDQAWIQRGRADANMLREQRNVLCTRDGEGLG